MRAGRLSDRLLFQKKVLTLVGGQYVESWPDDLSFTLYGEAQRQSETNCSFIIRYRPNIRPDTHRILFFGAIWNISDVIPDRKHTQLTITSDFSSMIEVTHLQSTTREFIDGLPLVEPPMD